MFKLRVSFMYDLLLLPGKYFHIFSTFLSYFLWKNETLLHWDNQLPVSSSGSSSLKWTTVRAKKSWITFTYLLSSRLTLSNAIFLEITPSFIRISSLLWSYIFSSTTVYKFNKNKALSISELIVANKTILNILQVNILLLSLMKFVAWNRSRSTLKWSENFSTRHWMRNL